MSLLWFFALFLAACEPTATPLPAFVPPTPTPTPIPATMQPIRYGLLPESAPFVTAYESLSGADVTVLSAPIPDTTGTDYDVIVGYGDRAGWTRSPVTPRAALLVNPSLAPLDDATVRNAVLGALDPSGIAAFTGIPGVEPNGLSPTPLSELRAALANAGWPDGFDLHTGSALVPGAPALAALYDRLSIGASFPTMTADEIRAAWGANRLHLALVLWSNDAERQAWAELVGQDNLIDLYALPISYLVADGLNISFTPDGFPLASRSA